MLGSVETAMPFVGGTVYKAFLSASEYHRWYAPISCTIKAAYVIAGTYYAQTIAAGFDDADSDMSQGYITNAAASAVIIIVADNQKIGYMAFVSVSMSNNIIHVLSREGVHGHKDMQLRATSYR